MVFSVAYIVFSFFLNPQEKETEKLAASLQALTEGNLDCSENVETLDKEFLDLLNENRKLKYRIGILKRVSSKIDKPVFSDTFLP